MIHRYFVADKNSEDFLTVDLLPVGELSRNAWAGCQKVDSSLGTFVVVSPAGLIELKQQRGSGQDMDDIFKLEQLQ